MFGFLINSEVNDDSVKLKTYLDLVLTRYSGLEQKELYNKVKDDFPSQFVHCDDRQINFTFSDFCIFKFVLDFDPLFVQDANLHVTVFGYDKYFGFMLQTNGKISTCSVTDSLSSKSTFAAKKLAKIFARKFGVEDVSDLLSRRSS